MKPGGSDRSMNFVNINPTSAIDRPRASGVGRTAASNELWQGRNDALTGNPAAAAEIVPDCYAELGVGLGKTEEGITAVAATRTCGKPPQSGPFGVGEMTAAALNTLRRLGRPVSASECAKAMLEGKQISDEQVLTKLTSKVAAVFAQKASSGQLRRSSNGDGRHVLWEINR
jgi:hypothetical protein